MRKLATAAAVSLALASGGAFGLGLGDIEMRSALNQPMNAEIRLTSVKQGELDGMIVQLASADAFARAGIERSRVLNDLSFRVDQSSGVAVIRISSNRPVVEPFLNFLLEVDWPQGRMVREYTVLLDPPVFMTPTATERDTTADQPALVQRGEEALVAPTPIERTAQADDGSVEVDLLGLEEELGKETAATPLPEQGERVSLEALNDTELLADSEPLAPAGGDIISLSDLTAPNTDAVEQREEQVRQTFDLASIEVELVGSLEEVSDDTVINSVTTDIASADDGSTIVSLDDILASTEESAEAAAQTASLGSISEELTVQSGDTLYQIAKDNAASGVSVQQMMMAMLSANESAFINNNINLVKAGAILRIPDADEAAGLNQTQALAAIGKQDQLWQDYRDNLRQSTSTQIAQQNTAVQETPEAESSEVEAPETTTVSRSEVDAKETQDQTAGDATASSETVADPDAGVSAGAPIETASLESSEAIDGLSEEARAILENARKEILNREELRIVADNAPTSTTASATADETSDNTAQRLGEVNRKLQLAREELSATRLQTGDLSEQASDLKNTGENLDALVSLRQNEVAQLEAQLEKAREANEEAAAREASEAAENAAATVAASGDAVADGTGNAADAVKDAVATGAEDVAGAADTATQAVAEGAADAAEQAGDAADNLIADASDALSGTANEVSDAASNSADDVTAAGQNALTDAGESLGQVELLDSDVAQDAAQDAAGEKAEAQGSWYQELLNDPKRMMIAGIGGVGLLGVLGTLLFRRRREDDDDDSLLSINDDVEFAEEETDAQLEKGEADNTNLTGAAVAGVAAAGAAGATLLDDAEDVADDTLASSFDELSDSSLEFGSETQAVAEATSTEGIDQDDTISEVDVYLAYGLHGQAEELLTKAIERKPDNPEYAQKLLQTYHAQGNAEGFQQTAENFHSQFGGESNPEWPAIAAMGADLRPADPLYASALSSVNPVGSGHSDGAALGEDDFLPANDDGMGSISRDFGASDDAVDMDAKDQSDLLDQSIDPAFAFDEGDLEATGDFSTLTDELEAENNESIDFPGFEQDATANQTGSVDSLADSSLANDTQGMLADASPVDGLEGAFESPNDLTLDLDQLSGDLELDSSELLNADLSDLELPDLSADNELSLDESPLLGGENADEMDTMLDLAKAYIDMGDKDSASSALGEIVKSGNPEQVTEAETLLKKIS